MRSRGKCTVAAFLLITAGLVSAASVTPRVDATSPTLDLVCDGFVIASNETVQMPLANVSIDVLITGSFVYNISVNCSFELFAESAANCTIAFSFPFVWKTGHQDEMAIIRMDIHVDGEETNHSTVEWADLSPAREVSTPEVWSLEECSYAVFNATFSGNQTRILETYSTLDMVSGAQVFRFDYAGASGAYWTGQTNETVTVEIDDRAGLVSLDFFPEPDALEDANATVRVATWHFNLDQFRSFWVGFVAEQVEFNSSLGLLGVLTMLVGIAALALIVLVIFRLPKKKQPKSLDAAPMGNRPRLDQ